MSDIVTLLPHDPLPQGHSVVLLRRFAEDRPRDIEIEMIVRNPDGSEETSLLTGADGRVATWEDATARARARAAEEGLRRIWRVDRTLGALEQEVIADHGSRSLAADVLADDDIEHGNHGTDIRDRGNDGGPRRF